MQNNFSIRVLSFEPPLTEARLIAREKRFFVAFEWESDGTAKSSQSAFEHGSSDEHAKTLYAHTNNTGSMMGLIKKGRKILLSKSDNPNRKLPYTLEAICFDETCHEKKSVALPKQSSSPKSAWLGVNTSVPNKFLQALFFMKDEQGKALLPFAEGYQHIRMEVKNGDSRLDACLSVHELCPPKKSSKKGCTDNSCTKKVLQGSTDTAKSKTSSQSSVDNAVSEFSAQVSTGNVGVKSSSLQETQPTLPNLWIECKNVSLVEDEVAAFPDAVSERGAKHLDTLMRLVAEGERALMFYVVQRTDGRCFSAADYIDPVYATKLRQAIEKGVEIYIVVANVQKDGIYYGGTLELAPGAHAS